MERRQFLKIAFGVAAGATAFAAAATAAPLSPQPLNEDDGLPSDKEEIRPAVVSGDEVDRLTAEQVHWGGHHYGWRRRHWHRRWHHRHWHGRHYW
ncbi:MAG: twin-arginine translocation (Tat) [Bradyrhizobium sp.]|uniref:twin-arginine translocation (Tat) n=1 Tax=Bradyrhizobium sp. TaxID=376 RepID=UPI0025BCB0CB|nr:twin-arginine translocation (Tat) [Bradyrhizobium sp.]MBI5264582.1 twin-arginine translocation (Tat) [Bradyrhizobium sp.]